MANISLDWRLASAKLTADESNIENVLRLKDLATHCYYQGNGYNSWVTHQRIDPNAFDIAFSEIKFERVLPFNLDEAVALLTVDRALTRLISLDIAGTSSFEWVTLTVKRTVTAGYSVYIRFRNVDWERDPEGMTLGRSAMDLLNSHTNTYEPGVVDGIQHDFSLIGATHFERNYERVTQTARNRRFVSEYFDSNLQFPKALVFLFDDHESRDIVSVCEQLCELFYAKPKSIEVFDCPAAHDKHNPLPPPSGAWSCSAWANYRKGFNPLKRPVSIDGSVRYPIWACETATFDKLLWHIDIVHTATESFFDVQTSEGPEYLQQFLDEHGLVGEIWQGDFAERWDLPMPMSVSKLPHDAAQTRRFLAELDPELTTSSLDLEQLRIANAYSEMLRERFNLEIDFSPAALKTLDDFIAQHYPQDCLFETTIDGVTACVGEIVLHSLNGQWAMSPKYPPGIAVDGTFANVRAWVEQRFHPDGQSSLVQKYNTYCEFLASKRQSNV